MRLPNERGTHPSRRTSERTQGRASEMSASAASWGGPTPEYPLPRTRSSGAPSGPRRANPRSRESTPSDPRPSGRDAPSENSRFGGSPQSEPRRRRDGSRAPADPESPRLRRSGIPSGRRRCSGGIQREMPSRASAMSLTSMGARGSVPSVPSVPSRGRCPLRPVVDGRERPGGVQVVGHPGRTRSSTVPASRSRLQRGRPSASVPAGDLRGGQAGRRSTPSRCGSGESQQRPSRMAIGSAS